MANLGEINEMINSNNVKLDVGSDTYITMTSVRMHIGRVEKRRPTTDGGILYTVGKGDNFFFADLWATTPEMDALNTLTQIDTDGDITETAFKIVYTDRAGSSKTFATTGYIRDLDLESEKPGVTKMSIFVRITGDTVTVS